jgi:hypothetical protein
LRKSSWVDMRGFVHMQEGFEPRTQARPQAQAQARPGRCINGSMGVACQEEVPVQIASFLYRTAVQPLVHPGRQRGCVFLRGWCASNWGYALERAD